MLEMKNHIYNSKKSVIDKNIYFTKYADILSITGCYFSSINAGSKYESDICYKHHKLGDFILGYISSSFHTHNNNIQQTILKSNKRGCSTKLNLSDKDATCLFGTKQELENWKYYIFNNSLPLFLSCVLNYDQHNNSKFFTPWLVNKQYTDEEIYSLLGFTKEEIELIENTIKKFERHSEWFKRYSNGKN